MILPPKQRLSVKCSCSLKPICIPPECPKCCLLGLLIETFDDDGCPGCPKCEEPESPQEPVCPICEDLECPYGKKKTDSSNGCPACDECLPNPACKKPSMCIKPKCDYGLVDVRLSNGCPGCQVCRKCEPVNCDEICNGASKPTILESGCPGCLCG